MERRVKFGSKCTRLYIFLTTSREIAIIQELFAPSAKMMRTKKGGYAIGQDSQPPPGQILALAQLLDCTLTFIIKH